MQDGLYRPTSYHNLWNGSSVMRLFARSVTFVNDTQAVCFHGDGPIPRRQWVLAFLECLPSASLSLLLPRLIIKPCWVTSTPGIAHRRSTQEGPHRPGER